jgi:hypothetical protein
MPRERDLLARKSACLVDVASRGVGKRYFRCPSVCREAQQVNGPTGARARAVVGADAYDAPADIYGWRVVDVSIGSPAGEGRKPGR